CLIPRPRSFGHLDLLSQTISVSVFLKAYLRCVFPHFTDTRGASAQFLGCVPLPTFTYLRSRATHYQRSLPLPKGSQLARFLNLRAQSRGPPHRLLSVSRCRLRRADRPPHSASRAYSPSS